MTPLLLQSIQLWISYPGKALQGFLTVEPVDSPHFILGNALFARQGGVDVHEGVGVQRVHEAQGVADLVGCHVDQVCQPHPWGEENQLGLWCATGVQPCFITQFLLV